MLMMAHGPVSDLLQELAECCANQPQLKRETKAEDGNGVPKSQSVLRNCEKPVKLNLALLQGGILHQSAKKVTRELFTSGRNVKKDIQNRAAVRKTLAAPQRHRPSFVIRRTSDTYKAPVTQQRNLVNKIKPFVGQVHHPSNRCDSKIYQRKSLMPVRKMQNNYESSTKRKPFKIPAVRYQNQSSSNTALVSGQVKIGAKVKTDDHCLANLENSVNLLNVDDVEEKLLKESSLLKSQILKQTLKNTGGDSASDVRTEEKILSEQIVINKKLKHTDEKLDKILYELSDLKEIIKNLSSNLETGCRHCSSHGHNSHTAVGNSTVSNNLEYKASQAVSDEQSRVCIDTDSCVPDSESKSYSLRRSSRLNNKGAQNAYESLRKSTKLLTTPRPGSSKKTDTPGRFSTKVIQQLNELYHD